MSQCSPDTSEPSLLPCPFCGGSAHIEQIGTPRQSTIYACEDCSCHLETGETFNFGSRWNTRASLQPATPTAIVDGDDFMTQAAKTMGHLQAAHTALASPASDAVAAKPFYGAQCPTYPDCNGGCGLGCTHEIEQARVQAATPPDYVLMPREATRAMTMAGCDSLPSCEHVFGHAGEMLRNAYRKMVETGGVAQPSTEMDRFRVLCAVTAERVCREHADPKAGYAAASAIRALAIPSAQSEPGK